MEIIPGAVLKITTDKNYKLNYAIFICTLEQDQTKYHFVNLYSDTCRNSFEDYKGWNVSLDELKDKINSKKIERITDEELKKINRIFKKDKLPFRGGLERIGLEEDTRLINEFQL